jgi:hypothetical protein
VIRPYPWVRRHLSRRPSDESGFGRNRIDGESRNRTDDTTIFSRVLYQLSYLAAVRRC